MIYMSIKKKVAIALSILISLSGVAMIFLWPLTGYFVGIATIIIGVYLARMSYWHFEEEDSKKKIIKAPLVLLIAVILFLVGFFNLLSFTYAKESLYIIAGFVALFGLVSLPGYFSRKK